ncbi:MAG: hypothetical protein K9G34_06375, partial [Melioribacteraceae bacterium]|nr:hypothetical protein [Melioribacteraceae bacterium]
MRNKLMKKYLLLFISMFLIAGTINSQQLVSPGGDAVDISFSASSITFNWDAYSFTNTVGGDDYYVLHLGTSTGVYPLNTGTSAGTSNSLAVSHTYDYNTVYYWQVTVVQDGGLVYTYPEKKFKTAMANPSISSPVNGATYTIWTVPSQVEWTLAANNTGVTYDLDYSGNSLSTGVTSPANGAGYSSTGSKSYTVHAIDDNSVLDNTNSSSTTSFTLNGVLTIPVISITGQSVLPTFKFDQFGSVTDYTLEIGTASGGPYTTRVVALSASNTTIAANEVTYYAKDDEMDPLT